MAAAMATSRHSCAKEILSSYDSFTKKCEDYVSASDKTAENIKSFLKALYGEVKETETKEGLPDGETLPELIVENFDEEQIWQELELQNEARVDYIVGNVARLVALKETFALKKGTATAVSAVKESALSSDEESCGLDDEEIDNGSIEEDSEDDNSQLEFSGDSDNDDEIANHKEKSKRKGEGKHDNNKSQKITKPSVVDDKFFKLSEMEEFLEREEQERVSNDDSSDESIDLFDDIPSDASDNEDDEGEDDDKDSETDKKKMHYSDFFDAPELDVSGENVNSVRKQVKKDEKKKNVSWEVGKNSSESESEKEDFNDAGSSDSETSDLQVPGKSKDKSSYEIRQERLQAKIKQLEAEALSEKPWQLKGEVTGESRPENALLEEALEFDLTHRPAPVMTEETTHRLEDIIKQRIKDKAWDDVERKEKPVEAPTEFKKKLVLDQEKSKLSLAQVYEQEYLKQVAVANPDTSDKPEEIPKEHVEIKALVDSLFRKLDALSNFHFTPKQVAPEIKIVTNIPAINMEEVAPIATSDATLLAPEEVKAKPKGDVKSLAERSGTDKKRERRQKKKHQRLVSKEKEKRDSAVEKIKPGLGNKFSKEKAVRMLEKVSKDSNVSLIDDARSGQAVKSSTTFFSQLQDEVTSHIKKKTQNNNKRKKSGHTLSAKRLKL